MGSSGGIDERAVWRRINSEKERFISRVAAGDEPREYRRRKAADIHLGADAVDQAIDPKRTFGSIAMTEQDLDPLGKAARRHQPAPDRFEAPRGAHPRDRLRNLGRHPVAMNVPIGAEMAHEAALVGWRHPPPYILGERSQPVDPSVPRLAMLKTSAGGLSQDRKKPG